MKFCKVFLIYLFPVILLGMPSVQADNINLKIGIYNFQPLVFTDDKGQAKGLFVDILNEVAKKENWNISYVPGTWDECLARLSDGKIDILTCVAYSDERKKQFDFTQENIFILWAELYQRKHVGIKTILDLENKKIAVVKGANANNELKLLLDEFSVSSQITEFNSYPEVLLSLTNSQSDVGLFPNTYAASLLKHKVLERTHILFAPTRIRFAVKKQTQEHVLKTLDHYFSAFMANHNSVYYKYYNKWMGLESRFNVPAWVWWAVVFFTGSFVVLAIFSAVLKRQVSAKTYELIEKNKQLRKSEIRLQQAQQMAKLGHWDWEVTTAELSWSDEVYEIFGRDKESFKPTAESFEGCIHPEDYQDFLNEREAALAENRSVDIEHRINLPDGKIRHVQEQAKIISDKDGNVVRVSGTVQDITERKKAENELTDQQESLRLFEIIVSSVAAPMAVINESYEFIFVNQAYEEFWGIERSEVVGKSVPEIMGADKFENTVKKNVDRCLSGETVGYSSWFQSPSQGSRFMDLIYYPYKTSDGEIVGLINIAYDISEHMEARNMIQRKENMLSRTESIAHIGSWQWDVATDDVTWSEELFRIFKRDPAKGAPSFAEHPELYVPEDMAQLQRRVEQAIEHAEPYELNLRGIRSDGEVRYCHAVGFPEKDEDGNVFRLYGFLQDNTDKYQTQQELNKLVYDHMAILDNISAYIYFKDTENNIIRISEAVAQITGLPKHEIEGRHSSEIYPEMADQYWNDDLDVIRTGKPKLGIVEPLPVKSGKERWLLTDKIPYFNENGQVAGVIVLAIDITDRIEAESLLKESELKFRSLFEYAADALYLVSEQGQFLEVNKSAELQTGYSKEELLEMNVSDLDPRSLEDDDSGKIWKNLDPGESFVISTTHRRKDGSSFPVEVHISVIELSNRRLIMGFSRDVTERKEIEKRLQQSQKMEAIGSLAGGIAHDFNNILSAIMGFTELALADVQNNSTISDNLKEVYSAGKRAKDLVLRILTFARQADDKRSPIRPSLIASEVLNFIRSTIPTTIKIQQDIESDSFIMGNTTQVHQVLMNICTNAAQAMEDSGGILKVSLKDKSLAKTDLLMGMKPGNYVEIKVSDTGLGIAPEFIDFVFDPYFTTKGPGEGTGMGLAVAYGIVENYGGKLTVDSQLGEGTAVTICLPATAKRSETDGVIPNEPPPGTERILFVDDEASIVKVGGQILERLGYSVTKQTSSIGALELFRSKPNDFDLVITDMTMPDMTGDKLAEELIKIRSDISIILFTGYSKKISDDIASQIGIKAFAYKPIMKADLVRIVRKVLDDADSES